MYPFILCINCGCPLGDIYDLFLALKYKYMVGKYGEESLDIDPTLLPISDIPVELEKELDMLNVTTCCRRLLITTVEFKTQY